MEFAGVKQQIRKRTPFDNDLKGGTFHTLFVQSTNLLNSSSIILVVKEIKITIHEFAGRALCLQRKISQVSIDLISIEKHKPVKTYNWVDETDTKHSMVLMSS